METDFGSSHDWRRGMTNGNDSPFSPSLLAGDKFTEFQCVNCNSIFRHFYDIYPDIFEAMQESGVPEVCKSNV